jgi:membrane-associated phospholipid phosphatase
VDILASAFAALLALVGILRWGALESHGVILRMAFLASVPLAIAFLRARHPDPKPFVKTILDFYVIVIVLYIFLGLGPLIHAVNPHDKDAWLIAFDRRLFGVDPTVALERFATPFLSDVLTVCYALYYFHPIILGGLLFADDRRLGRAGTAREFRSFAFVAVAVFFVSYIGYFVLPAVGPRFTVTHAGSLPRGAVSTWLDQTIDGLEKNKHDCFPSGHTMVVTAVLIEAWRRSKKTFLGFLPLAIGLVAATVYGRYHYVADVLAGLALAWPTVAFARWGLAKADGRAVAS